MSGPTLQPLSPPAGLSLNSDLHGVSLVTTPPGVDHPAQVMDLPGLTPEKSLAKIRPFISADSPIPGSQRSDGSVETAFTFSRGVLIGSRVTNSDLRSASVEVVNPAGESLGSRKMLLAEVLLSGDEELVLSVVEGLAYDSNTRFHSDDERNLACHAVLDGLSTEAAPSEPALHTTVDLADLRWHAEIPTAIPTTHGPNEAEATLAPGVTPIDEVKQYLQKEKGTRNPSSLTHRDAISKQLEAVIRFEGLKAQELSPENAALRERGTALVTALEREGLIAPPADAHRYRRFTAEEHAQRDPIHAKAIRLLEQLDLAPHSQNRKLRALHPPDEFSTEELQQAATIRSPTSVSPGRVDLRHLVSTFTIDPESSQDRDDAFSVEDLIGNPSAAQSGARWRLHLHVTDVASVIQPESPLWESAVKRGASIYLGDRVIPMLPDSLSTDALSLLPNQDRGAITFSVDVAEDFSLIPNSEWFNKTVISVNEALVFQQADQIISEAPDHPITVVSKIRDKLDQLQKEKGGRIPTQENFDYSKTRPADGETFNFDRTPLGSSRRMVATLSSLYSEAVAAVGVSGPNPVEARPAFGYSVLNDFDHDGKLDPILSDISANNLEGPALNYRLRAIKGTSAYATTPREHERTGIVSAKANSPMRSMSDLLNQHQLLAAIDETVQPIPEATLGELLTQISVTQSGCRAIGKEELLIARNSVYNDRINSMIAAGEKPEFEAIVLDTVTPGNDPLREKAKRVYIPEFDIEVSGFITYANKADLKRPIRRGDSVNVLLEPLKDIHSEEIFVDPVRKVNGNRRR